MIDIECVLFDFDGTLAHTEPAYVRAYREAIFRFGGMHPSDDEMDGFLNVTASEFAAKFPSTEVLVDFERIYYETHHEMLSVYDGIPELLNALRGARHALAIVSLKPRRAGELEIDLTGLRPLVDLAIWGDDVAAPKPAPDAALEAVARLGVDPLRTIVVGDSPSDALMARAAGMPIVGALWGNPSHRRLVDAGVETFLERPGELLEIVGIR